MNYDKMLDRLYLSLPKGALTKERFEMPSVDSIIQGNKTIIRNFGQVIKTINRKERHLFKFITKETGTAATISEGTLILNGKFSQQQVNKLFEYYIKRYVLCQECSRPDTHFIEQHGVKMLKCEACGAISPVKRL